MTSEQYFQLAQQRVSIYQARTAEEELAHQRAQAEAIRAQAKAAEERKKAAIRSRELLLSHLTASQRKTFIDKKWFVIEGGQTKTIYRIRDAGHAGNVDIMIGERVTHRLCCHCDYSIPVHDNMLAQKLTLEYDEPAFLRLANRTAA